MNGYVKLFSDIITSTIWQETNDCRVLWITLLALSDKEGNCTATVPALAKLCNLTIQDTEKYLVKFTQPDKYSRNQTHGGRRIKIIDGGYFIFNYVHYRNKLRAEERKDYVRQAVKRHRDKKKASQNVNSSGVYRKQCKPIAEAEASTRGGKASANCNQSDMPKDQPPPALNGKKLSILDLKDAKVAIESVLAKIRYDEDEKDRRAELRGKIQAIDEQIANMI